MKIRVYFIEADHFFLKRFLFDNCSHCFMTMAVGDQEILINPTSHYTYIGLSEGEYEGTWVDVDVEEPARKAKTIFEANTCVTQVKNFLGIRKYGIFTPYQLYRYLSHGQSDQKAENPQSRKTNRTRTSFDTSPG